MCLILCAYKRHPHFDLVIAANRDEFLRRPTARAGWWKDAPQVLAGRDLEQMGTWMGCTRTGRFAAVTNYREPGAERKDAPSRGNLVADFLQGNATAEQFLDHLRAVGGRYNGYNLLFGSGGTLGYHSNRGDGGGPLSPGIYGISNHLIATPWPKVRKGKERFELTLRDAGKELPSEALFEVLSDRTVAPDEELPSTGLPLELERMVSPIFTVGRDYGTRCSTVLAMKEGGSAYLEERDALDGVPARFSFELA